MLIPRKRERYDHTHRIVLYEKDEDGKCRSELKLTEYDDDIDLYYVQRQKELERLEKELMEGRISPVSFFMQYQNMTVKDLAARMKLGVGRVRSHLTREGFDGLKIATLKRYARIFGIVVSDFFQFTHVGEDVSAQVEDSEDRLVQRTTISARE
jgi:hypothetical protein